MVKQPIHISIALVNSPYISAEYWKTAHTYHQNIGQQPIHISRTMVHSPYISAEKAVENKNKNKNNLFPTK